MFINSSYSPGNMIFLRQWCTRLKAKCSQFAYSLALLCL